jgi:hypothetical protein
MTDTILSISDWRDRRHFDSLAGLDQAELDWAFVSRHPAAKGLHQPTPLVRLLRRDPSLRLLTFTRPECLPTTRGLRFRREGDG